jgi:germination protein M
MNAGHALPRLNLVVLLLLVTGLLAACTGPDDTDVNDEPPAPTVTTATGNAATATATAPEADATATPGQVAPTATTGTTPAATVTTATATMVTTPRVTATVTPTNDAATPTPERTLQLSVYFIRDEKIAAAHRTVPHTLQVAAAAIEQLLAGPTDEEREAGLSSAIPEGTRYLGTTIENGIVTVNLSSEFESGGGSFSMTARLAQVVYTLTQFPTVDAVLFELDGEPVEVFGGEGLVLDHPVDRSNFEELTPLIFAESPVVGDEIDNPVRVYGTANTFEAVFTIRILDEDGTILAEEVVMATSGSGTRGTFDVEISYDEPSGDEGTLYLFEPSARDGTPIHEVRVPVRFAGS